MGGESDAQFDRLQQQTEQRRLELLRTDRKLCQTLVGLVESELENISHEHISHEHAVQTLARANNGYVSLTRIFELRGRWDEETTNEIADKLEELRQDLDRVRKLVQSRGST